MALTHFSPFFSPFDDDLFGPLMRNPAAVAAARTSGREYGRSIALDIVEKEEKFELKADLPGVSKDDIKLHVDGDVLSLSVEKTSGSEEDKEEEGVKYHRVERSSMFTRRSIRLPESADMAHINAKYDSGVLSLDIPKVPKQQPRAITID